MKIKIIKITNPKLYENEYNGKKNYGKYVLSENNGQQVPSFLKSYCKKLIENIKDGMVLNITEKINYGKDGTAYIIAKMEDNKELFETARNYSKTVQISLADYKALAHEVAKLTVEITSGLGEGSDKNIIFGNLMNNARNIDVKSLIVDQVKESFEGQEFPEDENINF